MSNAKVTKAEYAAAKIAHEKAVRAFNNADKKLTLTSEAWNDAKVQYNAALPDGFYVEADTYALARDFPLYLKVGENWYWHNGTNFEPPEWVDDDGFDIEVIPIAEVGLAELS